jgi:hypothetical protein
MLVSSNTGHRTPLRRVLMAPTQIERLAVLETKVDNIERLTERLDGKVDLLATAVSQLATSVDIQKSAEDVKNAAHSTTRVLTVVGRWGALLISIINTVFIVGIAIAAAIGVGKG